MSKASNVPGGRALDGISTLRWVDCDCGACGFRLMLEKDCPQLLDFEHWSTSWRTPGWRFRLRRMWDAFWHGGVPCTDGIVLDKDGVRDMMTKLGEMLDEMDERA